MTSKINYLTKYILKYGALKSQLSQQFYLKKTIIKLGSHAKLLFILPIKSIDFRTAELLNSALKNRIERNTIYSQIIN